MMAFGHVPLFCICSKDELKNVMQRMLCALKDDGVIIHRLNMEHLRANEMEDILLTLQKKHLMGF